MSSPNDNEFGEEQVIKFLSRSPSTAVLKRWLSMQLPPPFNHVRLNWLTALGASLCTWVWAIMAQAGSEAEQGETRSFFRDGKLWVTQNFSWAYIITQDVWCAFLIYLIFSRFGSLKLGRQDEKPRFNDFTWFCMLFTCGVAVGLYVYGVSEPLYFYRQPTSWGGIGGFHYDVTKVAVQNDAQRAQQAIFMAVYHWGIHGWVPYILLAIGTGITTFRWGMPMTIRSIFYPLLGDHSLGLLGDLIDALSVSTTTFGVCTSLGLGVRQLADGLQYLVYIGCSEKDRCVEAGGTWDITGYGTNNCYDSQLSQPVAYESCAATFLATSDSKQDVYLVIIVCITTIATVSVLSGLDVGIKTLSQIAFSLGMLVALVVLMADNTWYLLSVMVQTTGYYLQYVIQVGFDCEAFQQLDFEFRTDSGLGDYSRSLFWGSQGSQAAIYKLQAAGFDTGVIESSGNDCGDQPNRCKMGLISAEMGAMLAAGAVQAATARLALINMGVADKQVDKAVAKYNAMMTDAFGGAAPGGIPCGSGWDSQIYDTTTILATPSGSSMALGDAFCSNYPSTTAAYTTCMAVWQGSARTPPSAPATPGMPPSPSMPPSPPGPPPPYGAALPDSSTFPNCPTTTVDKIPTWGVCASLDRSCATTSTYFDDSSPNFFDWWTIFYWAWWITWAPFVGFFVALISRGRTVREVIIGGFICPTIVAIFWFSTLGGLAIKMERTAELALQVRPDWKHAAINCGEHYSWPGVPKTPESKKLAEAGYYMLSCIPRDQQIYRLMGPYTNLTEFLWLFLWLGLLIYFVTSSDSGSMVDDIVTASGLSPSHIPAWQKIFWCWTEGIVAIMLTMGASGSVSSLQAASIILGLPYTLLLCMMVPAVYRALKKEMGDEDIMTSYRFNTQLCDVLEGFKPHGGSPCDVKTHLSALYLGLFAPFVGVKAAFDYTNPEAKITALVWGIMAQVCWACFIIFHSVEVATINMSVLGWLAYVIMCFIVMMARGDMRLKENIYGSPVDDLFAALIAWPFCLAQMQMHASTGGKDKPLYFASTDEMIKDMSEFGNFGSSSSGGKSTSTTDPMLMKSSVIESSAA